MKTPKTPKTKKTVKSPKVVKIVMDQEEKKKPTPEIIKDLLDDDYILKVDTEEAETKKTDFLDDILKEFDEAEKRKSEEKEEAPEKIESKTEAEPNEKNEFKNISGQILIFFVFFGIPKMINLIFKKIEFDQDQLDELKNDKDFLELANLTASEINTKVKPAYLFILFSTMFLIMSAKIKPTKKTQK